MQNLTSTLGRLAVVLAGALALGSCSRAEYAFLPKSASYLGTTTAAPKARRVVVAPVPPIVAIPTPEVSATEVPVAAAPAQEVAALPVAPANKATAPALKAKAIADAPAATATTPTIAAPAITAKPNLVQRLALQKVMRKLDKQTQKIMARKGDNTASTARGGLDSRLRYAIIFGVISLVFFVISGSVGNLVGAILLIIAILFLLFWLLDNL